jgi:biopolymer transport protein ExbB/TolQ
MPSLSDKTEIGLPLKNLLSLLGVTATAVWAYFGIIERLNNIETRATLFEADLVKNADQTPIDQEQFMLLEFVSEQVEKMSIDLENMAHNKVNIMRLQADMEKALENIEELKDKVRANGYDH